MMKQMVAIGAVLSAMLIGCQEQKATSPPIPASRDVNPSTPAGWDEGVAAHKRGDYATALRAWRPLAEQGDNFAQNNLGKMYFEGQGVPQDYAEAERWYRKAAERGNANAQHGLGFMYANGLSVPLDYAEAKRWFRKAAERGNALAQTKLGIMYATSKGIPRDYVRAYMWFSLAAAQGNMDSFKNQFLLAKRMTPAQIAEAKRLAAVWLAKHRAKKK